MSNVPFEPSIIKPVFHCGKSAFISKRVNSVTGRFKNRAHNLLGGRTHYKSLLESKIWWAHYDRFQKRDIGTETAFRDIRCGFTLGAQATFRAITQAGRSVGLVRLLAFEQPRHCLRNTCYRHTFQSKPFPRIPTKRMRLRFEAGSGVPRLENNI